MLWLSHTSNINLCWKIIHIITVNYCLEVYFSISAAEVNHLKDSLPYSFQKIFLWTRVASFKQHQRTSNGRLCERWLFFVQNAVAVLDGLYISKHSQLDTMINFVNNKMGCFCSMILNALRQLFSKYSYLEKKILPPSTKENSSLTNI